MAKITITNLEKLYKQLASALANKQDVTSIKKQIEIEENKKLYLDYGYCSK